MSRTTIDTSDQDFVANLMAAQIDTYRRQPAELVSHYNRETGALEGYRGRQILELLQNADDAGVEAAECTLRLDLSRERLVVANAGRNFSRQGIESLVISDCSPKQLDRNRFIGCKGLGFRSVLAWTDRPLVSSGGFDLAFDRRRAEERVKELAAADPAVEKAVARFKSATGIWPAAVMRFPLVPRDDDRWLREARTFRSLGFSTALALPLPEGARGDTVHHEIESQLLGLPASSLLFCRNLTRIEITGDVQRIWCLDRQIHTTDYGTVTLVEDGVAVSWDVHRRTGFVSAEAGITVAGGLREFEVAVAVPQAVKPNPNGRLCVFFPTHEKLPCCLVLHATLETTDDRNRLVDHASNREVLARLAAHVAEVVEGEVSEKSPGRALQLLSGLENADPELCSLGFVDVLVRECAERSIFPRLDGSPASATGVFEAPDNAWLAAVGPEFFPDILAVVVSRVIP